MYDNKKSRDISDEKLPNFNLKKVSQRKKDEEDKTINLRCSRYQAKSFQSKAKCPTSLSNSIHEILNKSGLDKVVNKQYDLKNIQKIEQMSSEQRKHILKYMFEKIPYEKMKEMVNSINNIVKNKAKIDKIGDFKLMLKKLDVAGEIQLIEFMFKNLDVKAREEVVKMIKNTSINGRN